MVSSFLTTMDFKQMSIFIIGLLLLDIVTGATSPTVECVYGQGDFDNYGWAEYQPGTLYYAANSTYLPEKFRHLPCMRSANGIFYLNGWLGYENPGVYKSGKYSAQEPFYIYIKYYAHVESTGDRVPRAYIRSFPPGGELVLVELQVATDYVWREAFFQIKMDDIIGESVYYLDIATLHYKSSDFLLIDTINIVQGVHMSHVSDFLEYCPLNYEGGTPPCKPTTEKTTTTDSTTEATEAPPVPIPTTLECIQDQIHFEHYAWDSFLSHKYALNSFELPEMFRGKLVAFGIFYFEGTFKSPNQQIFKPTSQLINSTWTFLYIKYYVHSSSSNGDEGCQQQQAYIAPVISSDGNQFKLLNSTSSDFKWREEVVEIDTEIAQRIGIQIVLSSLGTGNFLFVDEIIFVQGIPIKDQKDIVSLCRPAFYFKEG